MQDTALTRFLGGSPGAVFLRLAFVSLIAGALMAWLDIDPLGLIFWVERAAAELWANGFQAAHQLGRYLVAGAAIVVPVWLLTRLFSLGDMRRTTTPRWSLPGSPPRGDAEDRSARSP